MIALGWYDKESLGTRSWLGDEVGTVGIDTYASSPDGVNKYPEAFAEFGTVKMEFPWNNGLAPVKSSPFWYE